jgi:hypothetical protein
MFAAAATFTVGVLHQSLVCLLFVPNIGFLRFSSQGRQKCMRIKSMP